MSVKSIRFVGEVTSSGIVNFEGSGAPWVVKQALKERYSRGKNYNNIKYAKHAVKKSGVNDDGKPIYDVDLKISKDCLRYEIFSDEQPMHNPGIVYSDTILYKFLPSKSALLRGYFFADGGVKKKSSVYMSDAVQSSNNVSTIDIGTMNAPKDSKVDKDSDGGLTVHYKETIAGLTTYAFDGAIDMDAIQFISISEIYDRKAIDPNYADYYIKELEKVVGGKVKRGFFIKNTATNGLPEEGIWLNSDQVKVLIKYFFERIFDFEIIRGASGRAWLKSIKVMVKEDGLINKDYTEYSSVTEVMKSIGEVHCFYDFFNEEEAKRLYDEMDIGKKKRAKDKAEKKKNKVKNKVKNNKKESEETEEVEEKDKTETEIEEKVVE